MHAVCHLSTAAITACCTSACCASAPDEVNGIAVPAGCSAGAAADNACNDAAPESASTVDGCIETTARMILVHVGYGGGRPPRYIDYTVIRSSLFQLSVICQLYADGVTRARADGVAGGVARRYALCS